jgi:hypothetical protein
MSKLLRVVNLGDRYEINARILPAMLAVLPVTTLVLATETQSGHWIRAIGLGAGLEVFLAVAFSKLGHACGQKLERRLIEKWGGLPTTTWLLPDDQTHSAQQKFLWRESLGHLSGLDLESAVTTGDVAELRRAIDDAVLTVRNKVRDRKGTALLRQHNIDYGFSRNLAGLRWCILGLSALSLVVAIFGASREMLPLPVTLVELLFFTVAVAFMFVSSSYVRHCAQRYAESFLTTMAEMAKATSPPKAGRTSSR